MLIYLFTMIGFVFGWIIRHRLTVAKGALRKPTKTETELDNTESSQKWQK